MGILTEFIGWLPKYFFPKICYGCGKEGTYVCDDCRETVERTLDRPLCSECGREAAFGITHPICRRKYGLDGLISFYKYAGWAQKIIKQAKFGKHHRYAAMKELAKEMALSVLGSRLSVFGCKLAGFQSVSLMTDKPKTDKPETDNREQKTDNRKLVIVPVPLHWWRQFKRGFNQTELIARQLAAEWKIPMVKMLVRKVYTQPQTLTEKQIKLTKKQEEKLEEKYRSTLQRDYAGKKLLNKLKAKRRRENIKGAFEIRLPRPSFARARNDGDSGVDAPNVLLIDDVWTSGATMKECCRVLKLAGVKRVWGVTLLRA